MGSSNDLIAAAARAGEVAIESLTHSTPFSACTGSRRCFTPSKLAATSAIASGGAPATPARTQAASRLATLCIPRNRTVSRWQITVSGCPGSRNTSFLPCRKAPASISSRRLKPSRLAWSGKLVAA